MAKKNWVALVEDDADIRSFIVEALESEGYEVKAFGAGEEALSEFKQKKFNPPAVIFCDLIMHKMNGIETGHQLQNLTEYKNIPFVLMSAHNQLDDFRDDQKLVCRIDDTLSKPFELEILLEKVEQYLTK